MQSENWGPDASHFSDEPLDTIDLDADPTNSGPDQVLADLSISSPKFFPSTASNHSPTININTTTTTTTTTTSATTATSIPPVSSTANAPKQPLMKKEIDDILTFDADGDPYFEEVSLDHNPLPTPTETPSFFLPSRKPTLSSPIGSFLTRRTSSSIPENGPYSGSKFSESKVDVSGPYWSISSVLSDEAEDIRFNSSTSLGTPHQHQPPSPATSPSPAPSTNHKSPVIDKNSAHLNSNIGQQLKKSASWSNVNRPDNLKEKAARFGHKARRPSLFSSSATANNHHPMEVYISQTRPRMLPPKDPAEEKRHRQEYKNMMKKAKAAEEKKARMELKRKEERDRYLREAIQAWENEILPKWTEKRHSKKTLELWSNGIPPRIRGKVWILCIGNGLKLTKEHFKIYLEGEKTSSARTSEESSASTIDQKQQIYRLVDEDILRTLPSLCLYQPDGPLYETIKSVLKAHASYRSDIPYVSGTSFLAGMLLLNMNPTNAFICLSNLVTRGCLNAFFDPKNYAEMKAYYKVFNVLFAEHLPLLYLHFKGMDLVPEHYLRDWLLTLYAENLPLEISGRIWDNYFLFGDAFLFRAALALLRILEPHLWGGSYEDTIYQLRRYRDATEFNPERYWEVVWSSVQLNEHRWRALIAEHVMTAC
ncbi:uncharacterized protein VTP21DRAFT_1711 [Calcarisporiella thermophila]|uniref:uncharacterized protein n=1 Tax=Calcarisporiella thermophila TaxID=911321 RepID=UPI00374399D0